MGYHQHQQQQHQGSGRGGGGREAGGAGNNNALDEFIAAHLLEQRHHRARQAAGYQQRQAQFHRNAPPPPMSSAAAAAARQSTIKRPCHRVTASAKIVGPAVEIAQLSSSSSSSSTGLAPNTADHSSLPSAQIDPLLERVSLTVTAVSLEPLSGNEVVRHIRTKTDDVITRFLPCVDFLVNCQQELRQGLQVAQASQQRGGRRNVGAGGRSRAGAGMTPRQFHAAYVAPLPRRFERQNESLMAREHLRQAAASLESLVGDAAAAVPQGCDQVKNAFLGGMRENESWGLRKWLSKHGGAGSICNDLEEVMRHVKALRKEDETTKRLAEMLRPIARQAHERLKKDVPQAYQERSSAHPYLPFFHRLEACLKQMATYDPEEDDVVCLDDSSDEEEDVKVLTTSTVRSRIDAAPAPVAAMAQSSPVKKRDVATIESKSFKRRCNEDENAAAFLSKWVESYTAKGGDDVVYGLKQSRADSEKKIADQFFGERNEDDNDNNDDKGEKRTKTKEPEIICLYSTDEDDDENDTTTAGVQNSVQELKSSESSSPEPIEAARLSPPMGMKDYGETCAQHGTSTSAIQAVGTEISGLSVASQWRCDQCTFLNEAFASKCAMCNDDDSAEEGNTSDELANFLGETTFLDSYNSFFNIPETFARVDILSASGGDNAAAGQQLKGRALQSADARELECLAEYILGGGSLPKQAHQNIDKFWAMSDTFPQILMLFRSILQNPTSHRFLEPVNESLLFMMGFPPYTSIIKHPLCFHEIVCALSRSDDAVKYPHLTMRLSNGKLAVPNVGELQCWNMWNGLHLIEAIDLVLLNSLAYNFNEESKQLQSETESLRDSLWEGVNGCVPSKTLLSAAKRAWTWRRMNGKYGDSDVDDASLRRMLRNVKKEVDASRIRIYEEDDSPDVLRGLGIDFVEGRAYFRDAHSVNVTNTFDGTTTQINAKYGIVIATGAAPGQSMLDIVGLDSVPFWTYENVWDEGGIFDAVEQNQHGQVSKTRLIVVGGGPIGSASDKYGEGSVSISFCPLAKIDRAICEGTDGHGFIKIVYMSRTKQILGATIMSPAAGELVSELSAVQAAKMPFDKLATVMHSYPSYSIALQQMAAEVYYDKLKKSKAFYSVLKKAGL
ncbi:hypothetical protein ACHAW5_009771 [Stephanodiscus triporus]|uniref:RanBP2-type domain-containing protein n=1 Tax=Stephanodiscus triporus TaxID=2934178 RepID=A0ABD3QTM2_9STRA